MKILWKSFGEAVKRSRGDKSMREFEKKVKVDHSTLCRIESGKPCTVKAFMTLCHEMGSNPFWFVK